MFRSMEGAIQPIAIGHGEKERFRRPRPQIGIVVHNVIAHCLKIGTPPGGSGTKWWKRYWDTGHAPRKPRIAAI
jgi:hypothetical protein